MSKVRAYSQYSQKAAMRMGKMIHLYRKTNKMSAQNLADRAGISRTTLRKIENGDMACEIGIVFEVASLVGIQLFGENSLTSLTRQIDDRIALLPKSIHSPKEHVDDDF